METTTWAALAASLPEDICAESREAIRAATAPARHAARVQATRDVAIAEAKRLAGDGYEGSAWAAAALLRLDLAGIGGECGLGWESGGATLRAPCFRVLGSGRWRAADGEAYRAAAAAAADALDPEGTVLVRLYAADGYVWVDSGEGHRLATFDATWAPWIEAEARRLLQREAYALLASSEFPGHELKRADALLRWALSVQRAAVEVAS